MGLGDHGAVTMGPGDHGAVTMGTLEAMVVEAMGTLSWLENMLRFCSNCARLRF